MICESKEDSSANPTIHMLACQLTTSEERLNMQQA